MQKEEMGDKYQMTVVFILENTRLLSLSAVWGQRKNPLKQLN